MSRYLEMRRATLPTAVAELAEQLAEAGYKVTGPRLAVLQAASAHRGAFSVQELEQWLVARNESPGIASIFRTVRLLCDLQLLQRIHGLEECHRYSLGTGHSHHLVCTVCGAMERFDNCGVQSLVQQLEQRTGFQISAHLVELFGLCPRCRATAGGRNSAPFLLDLQARIRVLHADESIGSTMSRQICPGGRGRIYYYNGCMEAR
ncbi:transcriptional repressor [Candidatus Gracilibacteria bacterium]|nr:transcriptional repressor [Candidatus Gracilibacteria bacterium]